MSNQTKKPLIVEIDEAKKELAQCVNEILNKHGLNCYLIEPYMTELCVQIKATAQKELTQAITQIGVAEAAPNNTK